MCVFLHSLECICAAPSAVSEGSDFERDPHNRATAQQLLNHPFVVRGRESAPTATRGPQGGTGCATELQLEQELRRAELDQILDAVKVRGRDSGVCNRKCVHGHKSTASPRKRNQFNLSVNVCWVSDISTVTAHMGLGG